MGVWSIDIEIHTCQIFLILREGFINQFKLQNKSQISYVMWKRNLLINNIGSYVSMCHNMILLQQWNNAIYTTIHIYFTYIMIYNL